MRILARTLGITALMMAPAFSALAQEPPPPAATEPPAATTPPPAASPAMASTGGFGSLGQIAISVDLPFMNDAPQFAIVHESASMGGGSATVVAIAPSADYFVAPNISVGGMIGYAHGSVGGSDSTTNAFVVQIRGGYNIPINDMFSIWPHLGIGYQHNTQSYGGMDLSGYSVPLEVTVPFLWHPVSHFFLGLAPTLTTELASKLDSVDQGKETDIGVTALIGGYFGGV